ncbi:MAG: peptide chain release factor 2 [Gammaproteobacteria bacterium]|nr:peptide chain release factor 2 [Gammaproteobacteria bacterium]NNF59807.1 peptide chain release factor 2 [Gammaproteobacteria bacterium]NNM21319.1 peptide chain release factor 2 [Gammaproteobacteria bacterium]
MWRASTGAGCIGNIRDQSDRQENSQLETGQVRARISDLESRSKALRGYLDYAGKKERLTEVSRQLEDPTVWDDQERAQSLGRERARLDATVAELEALDTGVSDAADLLELALAEEDDDTLAEIERDLEKLTTQVEQLEFRRMFSGELDDANAFLFIQAGSGGTEAQDWAEMLLRMYLKWCESRDFKAEIMEASPGEVAGIKSATVQVTGDYAFGWLRTEGGVHRLVRKSPFDSGNRRHTSFAAVTVTPEIDDNIEIEINPADLRIDVYRASGAGGQHVNTTESAVRITHDPTGIVVQCQNDRSQHRNRDTAMKQLRARLYQHELDSRREKAAEAEKGKAEIGWGSQIRSYVLDQSRIKDLRTGIEVGNTQAVLDGALDQFIEASLKEGL